MNARRYGRQIRQIRQPTLARPPGYAHAIKRSAGSRSLVSLPAFRGQKHLYVGEVNNKHLCMCACVERTSSIGLHTEGALVATTPGDKRSTLNPPCAPAKSIVLYFARGKNIIGACDSSDTASQCPPRSLPKISTTVITPLSIFQPSVWARRARSTHGRSSPSTGRCRRRRNRSPPSRDATTARRVFSACGVGRAHVWISAEIIKQGTNT